MSLPCQSIPEEIRNRHEHEADSHQKIIIADKVRINHQAKPTDQRHDGSLLLPINKEAEPDGPEQQTPKQGGRIQHIGMPRPYGRVFPTLFLPNASATKIISPESNFLIGSRKMLSG